MVKAAKEPELKQAFTTHREETQGHIERLEQVFEMLGKRAQTKPCEAINGIVRRKARKRSRSSATAPRSIRVWSAAGQAVEHYEMARYGALAAWANQLHMPKAAALAQRDLARGNEDGTPLDAVCKKQSRQNGPYKSSRIGFGEADGEATKLLADPAASSAASCRRPVSLRRGGGFAFANLEDLELVAQAPKLRGPRGRPVA